MRQKYALKRIRKLHNLTQQQVADILYVSVETVYKWESEQRLMSPIYIEKLCNKFHESPVLFFEIE